MMVVKFINEETHEQFTMRDLPPGIEISPDRIVVTGGDGEQVIAEAAAHHAGWLLMDGDEPWPNVFVYDEDSIFAAHGAQWVELNV